VALVQHPVRDAADDLWKAVIVDGAVIDFRAVVLAQPDQHHLHQPAFDGSDKVGVRLDPSTDQHMVGFKGMPVKVNGKTFLRGADHHRFHAGPDGTANKLLGHAIVLNDGTLFLGDTAAVASHGGHDERLGL
jgi:hypothetical protein